MAKITSNTVSQLLSAVGGSSNVSKCGNCMTRLRLSLANNGLADQSVIKQIPGVMGVVESDEQFQIILGPGKAQQAAEMMNQLIDSLTSGDSEEPDMPQQDLSAVAAEQKKQMKSKQTSAVQRFFKQVCYHLYAVDPWFYCRWFVARFCDVIGTNVCSRPDTKPVYVGFDRLHESLW